MSGRLRMLLLGAIAAFAFSIPPSTSGQDAKKQTKDQQDSKQQPKREEPAATVGVQIKGIIDADVKGPYGESTGTEIRVPEVEGIVWELDLKGDKELIKLANKLHNETAIATGRLEVRKGEHRKVRFIIAVTKLKRGEKEEGKKEKGSAEGDSKRRKP